MTKEDDQRRHDASEPHEPIPLPEELARFLAEQGPYTCVTQATDLGTSYVIKAPAEEIAGARGTIHIAVRHELYGHPTAPVIRTVLTIFDQPERPLALESFINIAADDQAADFAALAEQDELLLLFYDEQLQHRLSKRVASRPDRTVPAILATAQRLRAAIPLAQYDFDRAKAAVLEATRL